jgi:hypothetical protein
MCKTLNFLYFLAAIFLSILSLTKIKYSGATGLFFFFSFFFFIIGNIVLLMKKDAPFNIKSNYVYVSPCGKPKVIHWSSPLAQEII